MLHLHTCWYENICFLGMYVLYSNTYFVRESKGTALPTAGHNRLQVMQFAV